MVSLLCRKKNTNLYHKEYDNHAVYELRGCFFFCGLPPANCGLRLSGPEILYTLLEALQVDMIKYNKYTHFICLKSVNCGPIDKEAK